MMRNRILLKVTSLLVLILFFTNELSYGLGTAPMTQTPGGPERAYALLQKQFRLKIGEGGLPEEIAKFKLDRSKLAAVQVPGVKFVKVDYANPPKEWSNNPILKETDLIEAAKLYIAKEAGIPSGQLKNFDVKDVYYELKEGAIPIERVEETQEDGTIKYTIAIHTKFVQMWRYLRDNDIWFEMRLGEGEEAAPRTLSVAWGIFERIMKHALSDIAKEGKNAGLPK